MYCMFCIVLAPFVANKLHHYVQRRNSLAYSIVPFISVSVSFVSVIRHFLHHLVRIRHSVCTPPQFYLLAL